LLRRVYFALPERCSLCCFAPASRFDTLLQALALFQRCTVGRLLRLSYAAD
jgi:hypothetical protein